MFLSLFISAWCRLVGFISPYIALIIFIVASLTDMLDGKIAQYNLITNFSKFMDPLAGEAACLLTDLFVDAIVCRHGLFLFGQAS